MKKSVSPLGLTVILFLSQSLLAKESNFLIGKWSWTAHDCKQPHFIFSDSKITLNTDADGEPVTFFFNSVQYKIDNNDVTVNFGKPHGFGKTAHKNILTFRKDKENDQNHIIMVRKTKTTDELFRCP